MSFTTLSGRGSHVRREGESTEFRVGRQAVSIMNTPHLADGDLVSIVGYEKNGTVRAIVMRNDTTGLVSQRRLPMEVVQNATPALGCGALSLLAILMSGGLGLFLLPLILPGAGFLLFVRYRSGEVSRARAILRDMPAPQGSS
jgi:hypothetical protein